MFQKIIDNIKRDLEIDDNLRESTLKLSRNAIRLSQQAVRATHKGEFNRAKNILKEIRNLNDEVEQNLRSSAPHLYSKGYVVSMQQEFVEASLFLALVKGETNVPDPETLRVSKYAYIQGLGDLIGELRRKIIDSMRSEDFQQAGKYLGFMEEVYNALILLDFPEGLIPGIRRKIDVGRSLIERTKNDLAYLEFGDKLLNRIHELLERLKNEPSMES
ncbi:MAG: haloacid dehalogenase [Candidatus Helarchaeota archaeon]